MTSNTGLKRFSVPIHHYFGAVVTVVPLPHWVRALKMDAGTNHVEHRPHFRPPERSPPAAWPWPDTYYTGADDLGRDACLGRRDHRGLDAELYAGAHRNELAGVSSGANHPPVIPLLPRSVSLIHSCL